MNRAVQGNLDIWLMDNARTTRVTFDAAIDYFPVWSPDGARMVFRSNRTDQADLYEKGLSGAGVEERFVASNQLKTPLSWSSDGRFLLYLSLDPQTNVDLWVVPMVGEHTPSVFLKTPFRETNAAFSPDGQWVAYQSNESGRPEIYVRRFDPPGAMATTAPQSQISTAGGIMPALAIRRQGTVLPQPGGRPDGGADRDHQRRTRTGHPGAALPHAHRLWRRRRATVVAVRRRERWALPDQHGSRQRRPPITLLTNWNPEAKPSLK